MTILGISAGFHDAALTLINDHGDIVFAGHSERYSKQKNDANLSLGLLHEVTKYSVQHIAYYERPWANSLVRFPATESAHTIIIRVMRQQAFKPHRTNVPQ